MAKSVAIVGLGALGSAVAGLLASAGIPVVGVARWREHREAIAANGLLLREGEAESRIVFPAYAELPAEGPYAVVIVLVKSFDTEAVAASLAGRVPEDTPVLTLQNGLGNAEALAARLKPEQVLAGTITFGALREGPGMVRLTGRGECEIGAWHRSAERHLAPTQELLARAGLPCTISHNVAVALWKKLAVNAVINPLTAILRVRNGELLQSKELEPLFAGLVEEVWQVAARHRIALPTPPELAAEARRVCQITAANISSMRRDVEEGRPTEIEAINGAVVRLGRERGLLTPFNQALAALVRADASRNSECR